MPTLEARRLPRAEALPERCRHRLRSEDLQREPRDQPPQGAEHADSPAPRPGSLPGTLTGLHILVVDDDPDILELFEAALRACGG